MPREAFIEANFNPKTLATVQKANEIIQRYQRQGYDLTLRQLYYQMVSVNFIANNEKNYKALGETISKARLAGLIDWDAIKDRTREVVRNPHWRNPAEIVAVAARQFRIDKWETQPNNVMVMVEKQALEGVLIPVCRDLDIDFCANKGYSSSSAMYELGKVLANQRGRGKRVHVLYLGDHDPSGIDMTRDVQERLEQFSYGRIHMQRLALNMDQIEQYNPPENPAKMTDSRAWKYIEEYGESSWELDALEPTVLAGLVTEAVERLRDDDLWDRAVAKEQRMRRQLKEFADSYVEPEDDDTTPTEDFETDEDDEYEDEE